jgi:hypothetical protein
MSQFLKKTIHSFILQQQQKQTANIPIPCHQHSLHLLRGPLKQSSRFVLIPNGSSHGCQLALLWELSSTHFPQGSLSPCLQLSSDSPNCSVLEDRVVLRSNIPEPRNVLGELLAQICMGWKWQQRIFSSIPWQRHVSAHMSVTRATVSACHAWLNKRKTAYKRVQRVTRSVHPSRVSVTKV